MERIPLKRGGKLAGKGEGCKSEGVPGVARGAGTRLPEVSAWEGGMPEGCLCREEGRAEGGHHAEGH